MIEEINKLNTQARNYGELIGWLVSCASCDAFWLDYGLRQRRAAGESVERELPNILFDKIIVAVDQKDMRNLFLLRRAFGNILSYEPHLADNILFKTIADSVTSSARANQQREALTLLLLMANMLADNRYDHDHIMSFHRTQFVSTYHSCIHLFDCAGGLMAAFDGDFNAPEKMVAKWPKDDLKKKENATCNGISYRETIAPVFLELLQKAVDINNVMPSRFQNSAQALQNVRNQLVPA